MKRIFITILITICGMTAMAQNRPDIAHQSTGGDRFETYSFIQKPNVEYNAGQEMIIVSGVNGQYFGYLMAIATQEIELSLDVDGVYTEIDISDLADGKYVLSLTSMSGITFRWTIDKGGNNLIIPDGIGDMFDKSVNPGSINSAGRRINDF